MRGDTRRETGTVSTEQEKDIMTEAEKDIIMIVGFCMETDLVTTETDMKMSTDTDMIWTIDADMMQIEKENIEVGIMKTDLTMIKRNTSLAIIRIVRRERTMEMTGGIIMTETIRDMMNMIMVMRDM